MTSTRVLYFGSVLCFAAAICNVGAVPSSVQITNESPPTAGASPERTNTASRFQEQGSQPAA